MKKILSIIPARYGSKGLKKKNILPFDGKPLLFWSIDHALDSKMITDVLVSSDSEIVLNLCKKKYQNIILDKRPKELSSDTAKSIDVLNYISKL